MASEVFGIEQKMRIKETMVNGVNTAHPEMKIALEFCGSRWYTYAGKQPNERIITEKRLKILLDFSTLRVLIIIDAEAVLTPR